MSADSSSSASPPRGRANWQALAAAAIDRLERPMLVVSRDGRVLAVNRAFRDLVGRDGARLDGLPWAELFLDAARGTAASPPNLDATTDITLRSGRLFDHPLSLTIRVEVNEHDPSGPLIAEVTSARPLDDAPTRPVVTRSYVVARAAYSRGLLRSQGDADEESSEGSRGTYCYEAMHAVTEPCVGCPVFDDTSELPIRRALAPSAGRARYCVVEVSCLDRERLQVQSTCLAEEVVGELVQAKVGWIADQGGLSARESEVLQLLYVGRSTRDIAMLLDVSERTVKYHQANVLRKLGADSRADLVRLLL